MSKINCVVCDGEIIHIGDWDYKLLSNYDSEGNAVYVDNPLPENAIQGEFDITQASSGKYVLTSNYYELRAGEYPSIGDQLDALFKAGAFNAEMQEKIQAVKDKYPKCTG